MNNFVGNRQIMKSHGDHMAGMVLTCSNLIFSSVRQNTWLIDTGQQIT